MGKPFQSRKQITRTKTSLAVKHKVQFPLALLTSERRFDQFRIKLLKYNTKLTDIMTTDSNKPKEHQKNQEHERHDICDVEELQDIFMILTVFKMINL